MTEAEKLLVAILRYKDERTFSKIQKSWLDKREQRLHKYVSDYYKEHLELPGLRTFCDEFELVSKDVDSRATVYLRKIRQRFIVTELSDNLPGLLRKISDEPETVVTDIRKLVERVTLDDLSAKDSLYSEKAVDRLDRYKKRVDTGGISYLSYGHPVMDKVFYGLSETDLVTIGGRAGSKKTWFLLYLAMLVEAVLPEEANDLLIVTNEIPSIAMAERMDALRYKLDWNQFLSGTLPRKKVKEYREGLEALRKKGSRIRFVENCLALESLSAKVSIYQPSAVFIDGSYLMEPRLPQGWEKITTITRTLKQITNEAKTPIVNTTQLGRGKGKNDKASSFDAQDEFAYSNSYSQDSDVAIRFYQDKQMAYHQEVGFQIAKGRNAYTEDELVFVAPLSTMEFDIELRESITHEEVPFA